MKVLAIVNPVSGPSKVSGKLRRIARRLVKADWSMAVRLTRAPGDAERMAAEAEEDVRAILAVGGDGTVREVVDGQIRSGRRIPVAVLRTGTENIVAKELRMPRSSSGLARTLMGGEPAPCDVGVVNDRHFLIVTGAGFDAEVVRRLAAGRNGHITHLDYFWPIWRTFWGHRFPRLRVTADGRCVFDGHGLAFVGNIPRYSVGLRILRQSQRDDGMLDLCVYPCETRARLVGHAIQTVWRRHDRPGQAVYRKCHEILIEGNGGVPLEIDGDPGGSLPARWTVLPRAATFLTPPTSGGSHQATRTGR